MEVRNITPNYTNNATSFGMAFKTPNPALMEDFTEFVTKKGRNSASLAKRGVEKLVKKHANDHHFDIEYTGDGTFNVLPRTDRALDMIKRKDSLLEKVSAKDGSIEKFRKRTSVFNDQYEKANTLKAVWLLTKHIAAFFKTKIALQFKPVDALPKKLRDVSASVDNFEKVMQSQLTKEENAAAKMAKVKAQAAKAEEKAAAAKQKAMNKVSSAFDSHCS